MMLFVLANNSNAQTKVVVIPLAGDDVVAELPAPIHGQVDANGTLFFSSGITSSSRTSTGTYVVTFDQASNLCIPAISAFDLNRTFAGISTGTNTWQIDVQNTADQSAADGGFFIILSCLTNTKNLKSASSKDSALRIN